MGAALVLTAGGTRQPLYDLAAAGMVTSKVWFSRSGFNRDGFWGSGTRGGGGGVGAEGIGARGIKKNRQASVYNLLTVPESEAAASVGRRHPPLEVWCDGRYCHPPLEVWV